MRRRRRAPPSDSFHLSNTDFPKSLNITGLIRVIFLSTVQIIRQLWLIGTLIMLVILRPLGSKVDDSRMVSCNKTFASSPSLEQNITKLNAALWTSCLYAWVCSCNCYPPMTPSLVGVNTQSEGAEAVSLSSSRNSRNFLLVCWMWANSLARRFLGFEGLVLW